MTDCRRSRFAMLCAALGLASFVLASEARAYDPATTNAGLTQRAAMASTLHDVLARGFGRTLGLFETVGLAAPASVASSPAASTAARLLWGRLMALDPAQGYRPDPDGRAMAVDWVMAGSVIAKTPPERLQNMFFDPSTKMGLRDADALDGLGHALRLAADSGGLRAVATGTSFSFEGPSSLEWLESPANDLGFVAFFAHLEHAVVAPEPAARESALAEALLALGGILTVLEDAGNPAQVRNDFRAAYLRGTAGSPFDRASSYERAVAERYGVLGVPGPRAVVRRDSWKAYFTAADGGGLADRTQRRFFSDGTVPEDAVVDRDTTERDVVTAARESLTYASPTVPRLDLRSLGPVGYVLALPGEDGPGAPPRALLAYQRVPGRVRFFLDPRVYADTARTLLPEISGYAAGLIDHLFRTHVTLSVAGGRAHAALDADSRGRWRGGTIQLLSEDGRGRRHSLGLFPLAAGAPPDLSVAVPADARRVAAFVRGRSGQEEQKEQEEIVGSAVVTVVPPSPSAASSPP